MPSGIVLRTRLELLFNLNGLNSPLRGHVEFEPFRFLYPAACCEVVDLT